MKVLYRRLAGYAMTLLSRKVDYALLILSHLQDHREGACARAIASRFELSRAFVANILKSLCQKELVTSHRGVKGGYVLTPGALGHTLGALMDALDESFCLAACNGTDAGENCPVVGCCPIRGAVAEVHRRLRAVLQDVTLAELLRPAGCQQALQIDCSRCVPDVAAHRPLVGSEA